MSKRTHIVVMVQIGFKNIGIQLVRNSDDHKVLYETNGMNEAKGYFTAAFFIELHIFLKFSQLWSHKEENLENCSSLTKCIVVKSSIFMIFDTSAGSNIHYRSRGMAETLASKLKGWKKNEMANTVTRPVEA